MIEKCETGKHYYDKRNYASCPFCEKVKIMQAEKERKKMEHTKDARWVAATITLDKMI